MDKKTKKPENQHLADVLWRELNFLEGVKGVLDDRIKAIVKELQTL